MINKEQCCCFTGHRSLPKEKIESINKRLDVEIEKLIALGVTDFISGGALGFDQISASIIIAKKKTWRSVRLIFMLPCKNQDEFWNTEQKQLYHSLLAKADEIVYVSSAYINDCMKKRNMLMIDNSSYCICALLNLHTGTGQTVRHAEKRGLRVVNVVD